MIKVGETLKSMMLEKERVDDSRKSRSPTAIGSRI